MNRPLVYKDTITISPNTLSTGGGSNVTRKVSELFTTDRTHIATITGDIQGKGKKQPKLSRQYSSVREHLTPTTRLPPTADESIIKMIGNLAKNSGLNRIKIFTDGSYTENNSQLQRIMESPDLLRPTATAGLVITDDSPLWKQRPIISIHFSQDNTVNATSVFHTECLALILALALAEKSLNCTSIHTDSESAYKLIRHPKRIQASSHAPLVRILQRHSPTTRNLVQHIHSHNEQLTKDKSKWTHEMYGNHLADRAAANDGSSLEPFDHTTISDLKTGHILTYAQSQPYWYVANKSRIMTLDTITTAASEYEHKRYLQTRDDIREKGRSTQMDLWTLIQASRHTI